MKKLILITGLLVALSGLIRSVDAQTSVVGYGSNAAGEIHLIDLESATSLSSFSTGGPVFQGLAVDSTGTTLYGSTGTGDLYSIDITAPAPAAASFIGQIRDESNNPLGPAVAGGAIESMDFNFNGTELWVTDMDATHPTTYSINIANGIATPVPGNTPTVTTADPNYGINDVVRTMAAEATNLVWIANDNLSMDFQSVNIDMSTTDPEYPVNVTLIGPLNIVEGSPFPPGPKIRGMDRAVNDVLYGLSNDGGVYSITETSGQLTWIGNTGHVWLALAVATIDDTTPPSGEESQNAVGEIEIGRENNCHNDDTGQRVAKELEFETYNTDPELLNIWNSLFGVDPETSTDDILTLQGPNRTITWEAGTLEMGGVMRLKVKTDRRNPALKIVKIEKAGKHQQGTTTFVSGTGGVNPGLADGGWHEVEIEGLDNVTVTFDGYTITGFLKKLKVKLNEDGTVKKFKLKIKGVTDAPNVCRGTVSSVAIGAPQTVVTAIAGAEYEEKIKDEPEVLSGHTEAEFEREPGAGIEGVDISSLIDGNNDKLKEREGPCVIDDAN